MNKYIVRHKTLCLLCDKHYKILYDTIEFKNSNLIPGELTDIPLSVFIDKLNITEYEFRRSNSALVAANEIKYKYDESEIEVISLCKSGIEACEEKKYKRLKAQIFNETIYAYIKWLLPIGALIVSIIALFISVNKKTTNTTNIFLQAKDSSTKTIIDKLLK